MRKTTIQILLASAILFSGAALVSACGSGQKTEEATEEAAAEEAPAADESADGEEMAYACPMHPEEKGKEGDTCSKCGMELELVAESEADSTEVNEN